MKAPLHDLETLYTSALQDHVANPGEAVLQRAYELGRKALDDGLGVLEMEQIGKHLRQLSHELRPTILDDYGLLPALEFLAEGISKRSRLKISVRGPNHGRLPSSVETALYRIVQEALTNVGKHARATSVNVRLRQDPRVIRCSITDDGVGFGLPAVTARKKHRGLGLTGIRQRLDGLGGTLQIDSKRGRGTQMLISIPLKN